MSNYGTPHPETEAILAAQAGDTDSLLEATNEMLPGEIRRLAQAADELGKHCRWVLAIGQYRSSP